VIRRPLLLILTLSLCACGSSPPRTTTTDSTPPTATAPAAIGVVSDEPWSFGADQGRVITTPNYRVYTTETSPLILDRLPTFLELALLHYRTSITPLPPARTRLDTYVMATRPQWANLTQLLMGDKAPIYLRVQRGGFAADGRALLFNIGSQDTFAIAAHEGWHQYTQSTFDDQLPLWLEEGIASYMEGFRWNPDAPDAPLFMPWSNLERYDRLRTAHATGTLVPLDELLSSRPQDLLDGNPDGAINYYAQVWALVHFLHEGGQGRSRADLDRCLRDASNGTLTRAVHARLGQRAANAHRSYRIGPQVFVTYFGDVEAASRAYDAFVDDIVRTGARDFVASGRSPVTR